MPAKELMFLMRYPQEKTNDKQTNINYVYATKTTTTTKVQ